MNALQQSTTKKPTNDFNRATPIIETFFIVFNNDSIFTMKRLLVVILWVVPSTVFCQLAAFEAKRDSHSLYFNHQLTREESFLSLALHYRLSPNVIAQYNSLPLGAQLIKGETIKIPVTATNLNATGINKNGTDLLVPLVVTFKTKASIILGKSNCDKIRSPTIANS